MKAYSLTFLFMFLFVSTAYAQIVQLQWQGAKTEDRGDYKVTLPNFATYDRFFADNNIFYYGSRNTAEKNISVSNFAWSEVSKTELHDLNFETLSEKDNFGVNYRNIDGQLIADVIVATFKREGNRVFRLNSFTVNNNGTLPSSSGAKIGTNINPLSSGTFYKIKVDKSGIFKITKDFLSANGINPATVNPKNFRIYGNGGIMLPENNQDVRYDALQEDAIQVIGENDGVWNDGDYALFYAQGPHGYNLYDKTNGLGDKRLDTRSDQSQHLKNIYEDYSYYYINFDKGPGKRVETVDAALPATLATRYDEFQFVNNDKLNLMKIGRIWVDEPSFTSPKSISFTTKSAVLPTDLIKFRTSVVAYKSQNNSIKIDFNGGSVTNHIVPAFEYLLITKNGDVSNLQGNTLTFNYQPNISSNPNGHFYINYAEVQYKENLTFNGSQMNFRNFGIDTGSGILYGFSMGSASGVEQIWDVADVTNAKRMVNKAAGSGIFNFGYQANVNFFNNEFVAFRAEAAYQPNFVGAVENQNLQALQNIDYLIITVPAFFSQAQRLANYHQTENNFNVQIVDVAKIYNEYSSGSQDITAIRDFITKLNRPAGRLKYVMMLGDASYDFKSRTPNNTNIVPSYQSEESSNYVSSFVTDDYFVMTEPQNSQFVFNSLPDLPIGRLTADNIAEATKLIDKTLAYYNKLPGQSTPFGEWRMKLDYIADDNNDNLVPFNTTVDDAVKSIFEVPTADKPEYNIRKLYLDSFVQQSSAGGPRYPMINQMISNDFSNSLFMFYFGHGGINGWAQERIFTLQEIQSLNNYNKLISRFPFLSTITCEFTLWDDPNTNSAGEQLTKLTTGGVAGMITSSRAITVTYAETFSKKFLTELFKLYNDDFETIGNSHLISKRSKLEPDHLKVNFLGDPAMKLARPKRLLVVDNIQSPVPNLIRALDFVKVTGHINTPAGTLDTTFNGRVVVNIFDKRLTKSTLNNDGILLPTLTYTEEGGAIVKASGTAVNGVFTVEFYVPNGINYTVGTGRMLVYADNKKSDVFQNQAVQVGDINPNGINDNEPPKVKLYMNNTNFADGGITDKNPMLLACITDDTGINASIGGIGHDITVYLDGQIINTIVLNDFYSPGDGNGCINPSFKDYQKGNVTYPFRNLAPGEHTLTFKVWDINNNSTTETLRFIVKEEGDEKMVINRLLNWPNPFTNKTYIQFEHNCDDIVEVNVQIFTITGKLVRTFSQSVTAEPFMEGYRTPRQAIEWDGKDDFGDTVGKGTYLFKVYAKSQNQEKCKGGATAVEKMVMLK